jgi:hypothetical protein
MRHFRIAVACLTLAMLQLPFSMAQSKPMAAPAAPIPSQILAAKRVFIANAGGDEMAPTDPVFSGGPDRAYNQFYAAIKNWGRFNIVSSPADADLLLEIRQEVQTGLWGIKNGFATPLFHLEIRDPKTNALLWGLHVHSEFGVGQGSSDRNFDQAVNRLVTNLQALVTPPEPAVQ